MTRVGHVNAEPAQRRVGQKETSKQRVVLGFHRPALTQTLYPFRSASAGSVQCKPVSAGLQPNPDCPALRAVRVWASDVRNQQAAQRQPLLDVGEIVSDGCHNVLLCQESKQAQPSIIVVVAGG